MAHRLRSRRRGGIQMRYTSDATTRHHRILTWLTTGMLTASVTLNVVQASRGSGEYHAPRSGLALNSVVDPIAVKTIQHQSKTLDFRGKPTILYYFSPACKWCERNWLNVKALMAFSDGQYRFIGLSAADNVADFLSDHRLAMETYVGLSLEDASRLGLGATPHTLVISGDGRLQHSWAGAYTGALKEQVERSFGAILPGVLPSKAVQ